MRRLLSAFLALLLLCLLGWAGYSAWQYLAGSDAAEVPALAPGHQEVAWFSPATSGDGWERLVAALRSLEKDWATVHPDLPPLRVSFDDAFLEQTASIPQIALNFAGFENAKLWIRWYKISGEIQEQDWLTKLHKRQRTLLAVIGGDDSDQALTTARKLQRMNDSWAGPLFLVKTATLDRYDDDPTDSGEEPTDLTAERYPRFMDVYKNRTFRFCFTNEHIAHAVLDFVQDNPHVWPENRDPVVLAGLTAQGNSLNCLGILAASGYGRSVHLSALAWVDDHYSQDLANRMFKVFEKFFYHGNPFESAPHYLCHYVSYSVGGFYQPNPREQLAVDSLLNEKSARAGSHHLLAVPTGVQPARRLLRTLCRAPRRKFRTWSSSPAIPSVSTTCIATATWNGTSSTCRSRSSFSAIAIPSTNPPVSGRGPMAWPAARTTPVSIRPAPMTCSCCATLSRLLFRPPGTEPVGCPIPIPCANA